MAERVVSVMTVLDFGSEPISAIEVTVTCGGERFDCVLDGAHRLMEFPLASSASSPSATLQYQYRAYAADRVAGGQPSVFVSPLFTTESSVIVIDPRELYRVIFVAAAAQFSESLYMLAFVDVRVEAANGEWAQTRTLELTKGSRNAARFIVDARTSITLQQRTRFVTHAGDVIDLPWQPAGEGILIIANGSPEPAGVSLAR